MAERTKPAKVTVEGVAFEVDTAYIKSWAGIRQAARLQSDEVSDADRMVAMVEYYERAIPNMDDVTDAIGDMPTERAMELFSEAVKEATPKN